VTDQRGWDELEREVGLVALAPQPWRRAEARLVAHRLRQEIDEGRRPGDVVVLVRATASLRLLEQALEEQGLPTYVVGGRGYWSQEQVRDGVAYLSALANPRAEESLLAVLASPFCGVGTDALVLLSTAGRERGGLWPALRDAEHSQWPEALSAGERERLIAFARLFAAERAQAERLPAEVLLERAIVATGYDLAVLARSGGERRLANLRKLMRLAREYEGVEGRDLRGFLTYAATQDLREAREGEAALESEGLDAVRLMTVHRAKGLEFPVVCVADLGRAAGGTRERLLIGRDGRVGLKLAPIGGGELVPALGWQALADAELAAEAEEERRLFYVAMTRARERLILSGGVDCERWPEPRPGGPPLDWIARALTDDPRSVFTVPETVVERRFDDRPARLRCALNAPATLDAVLPRSALTPAGRPRVGAPATALPDAPAVLPAAPAWPRPAPQRLSYSSLGAYARCGYRFYLQRLLKLPPVTPPPREEAPTGPALAPTVRGSIVHRALEELDFSRPAAPSPETVAELAAEWGVELTDAEVADIRALVDAFASSPLCARLAAARHTRREAPFAFGLDPSGGGPLVTGFLDAAATEPDGGVLIVDYKSDRLEGATPEDVVEREYATQRIVYALAALRDGAPRAEVAYCFLERPGEPVTRAFTAADASALTEHLAGLARGLIEGRYPVAEVPHRELCGDCPGRASMCSWGESETLRELPANVNGLH
jgi:ATP-dependent helicase/nuclease subunit A